MPDTTKETPVEITGDIAVTYSPKAALIVYKADSYTANNQYYLESRSVGQDGTLGVAKPVSQSFIKGIADTFKAKSEMKPHGLMPDNYLAIDTRFGSEKYIWWTPPGKRQLYFSEALAMKDGLYNVPGCIYYVKERSLYVFCFKGRKPSKKSKLLFGPFFNYYDDGKICLGSAKADWPEDLTWKSIQEYWEKLFWGSENSHSMKNPMKEGFNLAISIKESESKPYDTSLLQETAYTIESFLLRHGR